jgi:hypothetical protein
MFIEKLILGVPEAGFRKIIKSLEPPISPSPQLVSIVHKIFVAPILFSAFKSGISWLGVIKPHSFNFSISRSI